MTDTAVMAAMGLRIILSSDRWIFLWEKPHHLLCLQKEITILVIFQRIVSGSEGFFLFACSHSLVAIWFLFLFKIMTAWSFGLWRGLWKLCFPWRNDVIGVVYVSSEVQTTTFRRGLANHFGKCSCVWRLLWGSRSGGSSVFTGTSRCCAKRSVFTW